MSCFVHLNVHTEYSMLKSTVRIDELIKRAKALGMPAVAITDSDNLYGAVDFYQKAHKAGIRPILGCEISLTSQQDNSHHNKKHPPTRITLLAKNNQGWHHLIKLVTTAHLESAQLGIPQTNRQTIAQYAEGLIALGGCLDSPINHWLFEQQDDLAREEISFFLEIFGKENFFLEISDHGIERQQEIQPKIVALAKEFGIGIVGTNDVRFLHQTDHDAHDALLCIGESHQIIDENRTHYPTEHYFKSSEEMEKLLEAYPEAYANTLAIAKRCEVTLHLDSTSSDKYPQFDSPDGSPREDYLQKVCEEGLKKRYPEATRLALAKRENLSLEEFNHTLKKRLDYEINTINDLRFASYFLITADFIQWARDQGIPVGPGRGSAAGSLVAYTTGITNICPLRFGLLFERFLNPERVSPPDVDIDFCQTRRTEVIEYVRQKYGERSVSHIITYGTLGAKSVIRDVARVLGIPYGEADAIAKMISAGQKITLDGEFQAQEELRKHIEGSSTHKDLWDLSLKLEGLKRNTGVHAAGVVIGDRPLDEHCALSRGKEGEVVCQCDKNTITEVGLLKMDFLGLKTLTIIEETASHIRAHTPHFSIESVALDNAKTLQLLNAGETMGVFQLESGGMVETCKKYGIEKIEDIIDLLALYRPGAMQFIDEMIAVKKGEKKADYAHPLLETICGDTFGVMIYQEQVQNAAKMLAGYTLGGADILRRAMGKKKPEEMAKQRAIFVEGCKKTNGIDKERANDVFDKIANFAGYGFNKSHSACYGHISYWTAYLKANYPIEFFCGLLSNELTNTEKIGIFIAEANRIGITVLPPDINHSQLRFTPEKKPDGQMAIRYGLSAIKNVGEGAMESLLANRKKEGTFASIDDLANRVDSRSINKRILISLICAGALDSTKEKRASMEARLEQIIAAAATHQRDKAQGQSSLFGQADMMPEPPRLSVESDIKEWPIKKRLDDEKELLGYCASGHPLDAYWETFTLRDFTPFYQLERLSEENAPNQRYEVAGLLQKCTIKMTRTGKQFAILLLEDFNHRIEVLCWEESFLPAHKKGLLTPGNVLRMKIQLQRDVQRDSLRISATSVALLKKTNRKAPLVLYLKTNQHDTQDLLSIKKIIKAHPGKTPVKLSIHRNDHHCIIHLPENFSVKNTRTLHLALSVWQK